MFDVEKRLEEYDRLVKRGRADFTLNEYASLTHYFKENGCDAWRVINVSLMSGYVKGYNAAMRRARKKRKEAKETANIE